MKRVVVITGGSAGIGRAAARAFVRDGAEVALIAREEWMGWRVRGKNWKKVAGESSRFRRM
jgi:NAD(P)-dependent dehydrogenase (short-subunit alcohol dehydrogenase family)